MKNNPKFRIHGGKLQDPAIPIGTIIINDEGKCFQKVAEHRNLHSYKAIWGSPVYPPIGEYAGPTENATYTIVHIRGADLGGMLEILTMPHQEKGQEGEEES